MKNIFKNSSYLLISQGLTKLISFVYTIYIARALLVENFGFYVTALAYFSLVSAIAELGFNRFIIREGARNADKLHIYVCNTILARLSLTSIVFAIFAVWIYFFDPNSFRVSLSLMAVMAVLPQSIALTLDAALIAKQKMKFSAIGLLVLSVVTTGIGVYLIHSGYGVYGAVSSLALGQILYALVLWILISKSNINCLSSIRWHHIREIALGSLPYGVLGVLGLLYFKIDTILLSYLKGAEETGIYGAAYRFLEALVFIPSSVATAMFPVIARLHDKSDLEIKKIYYSSLKLLGLVSIPLVLGYLFILPHVIRILLPSYLPAIQAIQILAFTIPFMFIHVPGAMVLLSSNKYLKPVLILSICTLLFNVVVNLIFIPKYGYMAASIVTVLSEILTFVVFFTLLQVKIFRHAK